MVITNPSEDVTKFIFNKSQFSSVNSRVKYSAFMPPVNKRLSVFLISSLSERELWEIGHRVEIQRNLPLLARADIKVLFVSEAGLVVDEDDNPLRHANIVGWPEDASEIKLKALELADKAELCLK
jgi:hypothetical protein